MKDISNHLMILEDIDLYNILETASYCIYKVKISESL